MRTQVTMGRGIGMGFAGASDELNEVLERYLALRDAIDRRERPWSDLVEYFTDDAVFIDPAWGRIEGIDEIREFLVDSMTGIEEWTFPVDQVWVDGDEVGIKYRQVLPGGRQQSGYSTLIYAGGGKFRYEEDILNMAHVLEDLSAISFRPPEGMKFPPAAPDRDFSRP